MSLELHRQCVFPALAVVGGVDGVGFSARLMRTASSTRRISSGVRCPRYFSARLLSMVKICSACTTDGIFNPAFSNRQWVGWFTFFFRLACHGRNDQGRRVVIAHVILKNDRRAVTVLFRAGARPEMSEEDVSALEFPVLLQNCTSMLLCAKPAAGCSAAGFVQGMVVWLGQRCMTT